jgi:Lysophospholipase L1 and related esterases
MFQEANVTRRNWAPLLALTLASALAIAAIKADGSAKARPQNEDELKKRMADLQAQVYSLSARLADWPQLGYFRDRNREFKKSASPRPLIVFIGDSITAHWNLVPSGFFPGENYVNRGLDAQISGQMLLRLRQDVLGLSPDAVVILGGVNELSWGPREERLEIIEGNIQSMAELAQFNHVAVIICSLTPAARNEGGPEKKPRITALNRWLRQYSKDNHLVYLDYFSRMTLPDGSTREELFADGTHPNDAGYRVMASEARAAISQLGLKPRTGTVKLP